MRVKQKLVLKLLAKGMTAKEIAELLEISTRRGPSSGEERCQVSEKRTSTGIGPVGKLVLLLGWKPP